MADAPSHRLLPHSPHTSATARGGRVAPIVDVILPLGAAPQPVAPQPVPRPVVAAPTPPPRAAVDVPRPSAPPLSYDPPSTQVRAASDRPSGLGDPLFAAAIGRLIPQISAVERAQLASVMFRRELTAGETVYSAKAPTKAAWLVGSGMLRVDFDDAHGQPQGIGAIESGTLVGAEALFGQAHHLGAVVAASDAVVYELSPTRLDLLERVVPATAQVLLAAIHGAVGRQQRAKIVRLERALAQSMRPAAPETARPVRSNPLGFLAHFLGQAEGA